MVDILLTLKQNACLQEKEKEKAKDNNVVENETGVEDVDEKIKWEIHFKFDHSQCLHKTPNENFSTIKVITNKKMITRLCFINPITTQISSSQSSFDTIISILFFSSELYMLLSADLTLIKCRLKT